MPPPSDIHPAIQDARFDLSRSDFAAAVRHAEDGLTKGDLNRVQRERLLLLQADAFHFQQQFAKALACAREAATISEGQSPQAQFIQGRALFALGQLEEARDAFEVAEILMDSPTPPAYLGDTLSVQELWANVGVNPTKATVSLPPAGGAKRTITYEWAADLVSWRSVRDECLTALSVLSSRVVPRPVLSVCQNIVQRRLAKRTSRALVLIVRNDSPERLTLDFHRFSSGQFLDKCGFPGVVPPQSTAIAGAHATGLMKGLAGTVGFAIADHQVCLTFDCPTVGSFSPRACIVPRRSVGRDGQVLSPLKSQRSASVRGSSFRVTVGPPGYVQTFSVCKRNPKILADADVLGIVDYANVAALRKLSAVAKSMRQLCHALPPSRFGGSVRCFPDYRLASDLGKTNWIVGDPNRVRWYVKVDARLGDEKTVSFVDTNDQRVFFLAADLEARAMDCVIYYGTTRSPIAVLEESMFSTTKRTTFKVNGRTVGTYVWKGTDRVELVLAGSGATALSLSHESETSWIVTLPDRQPCARLLLQAKNPRSRSATIAELHLFPGCDALLSCLLAFVALFRA